MHVATRDFRIDLPSSFVRLSQGGFGGRDVLQVACDYRSTIRETKAATMLSVQRLRGDFALPANPGDDALLSAASELIRLRDSQSGLPVGCPSRLLAFTLAYRNGVLGFEMLSPLSCVPGATSLPPPEFVRRTAVRAAWPIDGKGVGGTAPLVFFAGARQADWQVGGVGNTLVAVADTFALVGRASD
jgi:hypothetical protein